MKAITNLSVRIIERWLPDAFLFAIVLTIVVFIAAMIGTGVGPLQVLSYWGSDSGFWGLLGFSMQMCLVVVLGSALAQAPVVNRLLKSCAGLAHTPKQGILVTVIISGICMWLNWGLWPDCRRSAGERSGQKDPHDRLPCSDCRGLLRHLHVACWSVRFHSSAVDNAWRAGNSGLYHGRYHDGFHCGNDLLPGELGAGSPGDRGLCAGHGFRSAR